MQNENQSGLKVGELIQSKRFTCGRTVEINGEERVVIGYRDEVDPSRADAVYKVVSITERAPSYMGNYRGELVVARRMNSLTEEGDEVIEFIYGGKGHRSISTVQVLNQLDDEGDIDEGDFDFAPE